VTQSLTRTRVAPELSPWRVRYPSTAKQPYSLRSLLAQTNLEEASIFQDGHAILRLQGSALRDATLAPKGSRRRMFHLLGPIRMAQAIRLRKHGDAFSAKWKLPMRAVRHLGVVAAEARVHRYFAIARDASSARDSWQLACLPGRWRIDGIGWSDVTITCRRASKASRPCAWMEVAVDDPNATTMLAALQADESDSIARLAPIARELLHRRARNPYAATVAAYVLSHPCNAMASPGLVKALHDLASTARALPDASILIAALMIRDLSREHGDFQARAESSWFVAWRTLKDAVAIGPPLLRFGLTLLGDCLEATRAHADLPVTELALMNRAWRDHQSMCGRVDLNQAFCVFDVSGMEDVPLVVDRTIV
jgi:hypothetical protein